MTDPEELVISREEFLDIEKQDERVFERSGVERPYVYLEGKSYQEIAEQLSRHVKSIDNALQRVKRKLERYLEKRESEMMRLACRLDQDLARARIGILHWLPRAA